MSQPVTPDGHLFDISRELERTRHDLLDIGLRNPLLNYRTHSKKGNKPLGKRVPVQVSDVQYLYQHLLKESPFAFLPKPDEEQELLPAVLEKQQLQTEFTAVKMQSQLLDVYRTARTLQEEQGINNLFLVFGLLKWYEAENSEEPRYAPLVLMPVELERDNAQSQFKVRYRGDEISSNRSLEVKVKEFHLTLPEITEPEDLNLQDFFDQVKSAVRAQKRWEVLADQVHLSFFSFTKFLMHRDLDAANWPEQSKPQDHQVVASLLGKGFTYSEPFFGDKEKLDPHLNPVDLHHVMEADSSQTVVIHEVMHGRNLVVEGPPGTGKSQTITNMIAGAIHQGKRVLFVSEKMAALEVVKRRLDAAGLGVACLELHSHKTNKKAFLQELKRTYELGEVQSRYTKTTLQELQEARDQLNTYAETVNQPMGESGVSPQQAFGELHLIFAQHGDEKLQLESKSVVKWTPEALKAHQIQVSGWVSWIQEHGHPERHPHWGTQRTTFTPLEEGDLRKNLQQAEQAVRDVQATCDALYHQLGFPQAENLDQAQILHEVMQHLQTRPDLQGLNVTHPGWSSEGQNLQSLLRAVESMVATKSLLGETLTAEAWTQQVLPIRDALKQHGRQWYRIFVGEYRSAAGKMRTLYQSTPEKDLNKQIETLNLILEHQKNTHLCQSLRATGQDMLGVLWKDEKTSTQTLLPAAEWLTELHAQIHQGKLPNWTPRVLENVLAQQAKPPALQQQIHRAKEALRTAIKALGHPEDTSSKILKGTFLDIQQQLQSWQTELPRLKDMVHYLHIHQGLKAAGLEQVTHHGLKNLQSVHTLPTLMRRAWLEAHLADAYQTRPLLQQFDSIRHNQLLERYRNLEDLSYLVNRERVAEQHWKNAPKPTSTTVNSGQISMLRREFEKKTRHLAIRKLMSEAGQVIQGLKPVFMMSPLSIANFLPPGRLEFDLVIFDEASQVKPADALGAILRGRQMVVVGDSKQLPPSNFFERTLSAELDDEEESVTSNMESILSLFRAQNLTSRMLKWHYRSRHESLIAVSNRLFYENDLVIFPGPETEQARSGLTLRHLSHTTYDRGGTRTNPQEARTIAKRVIQHAREHPQLTLGVVAFSTAQQRAIEDELEILLRQHPELNPFFSLANPEPFFVKNLENVQGDERDVIFISVGYGRDEHGKLYSNFGPVNTQGGEKRLNVLFTRARLTCEVFSNFKASDLMTSSDSPEGVRALKTYLHYAETHHMDLAHETARGMDSPFEEAVKLALENHGYQVRPQVGVAGYFIDLAVVDPEKPGRYVLGVECDGAMYHSARTARDRDRLRQRVLESKGWSIHRIWSTDFFANPKREIEKTVQAIEKARQYIPENPIQNVEESPQIERQPTEKASHHSTPLPTSAPPYQQAQLHISLGNRELHEIPGGTLADWLEEVVKIESPIHWEEAKRRVANAVGVQRIGKRIEEALRKAWSARLKTRRVKGEPGNFLWMNDMHTPSVRSRSHLPANMRKWEYICDEEIQAAITAVVAEAYGLHEEDISAEVGRKLGMGRTPEAASERIQQLLQQLVSQRQLTLQEGQVRISKNS